jgi:putative ABC transport system ATP-binding protein
MEGNMSDTIIQFIDVVKTYGSGEGMQTAVDHVNFTIDKGEFTVILGQSGAGKSTVLNMLGGMDTPTGGTIIVDGEDISRLKDRKLTEYRAGKIGFIFQFYNLLPGLTAKENIALMKNIRKDAADPMEMLQAVGLHHHADKFPSQMSGGEQQRVSIARALAKKPEIIIGDEPTGALDSETGVMVLTLIHDICRKEHKTVVLVTHNADIALCADKVIRMRNGKISEVTVNESPVPVSEVNW